MTTFNTYIEKENVAGFNMLTLYKGYIAWRLKQTTEDDKTASVVKIQDLLNELAIMHQYCVTQAKAELQPIQFNLDMSKLDVEINTAVKNADKQRFLLKIKEYGIPFLFAALCAGAFTATGYLPAGPTSIGAVGLWIVGVVAVLSFAVTMFSDMLNVPTRANMRQEFASAAIAESGNKPSTALVMEQMTLGETVEKDFAVCVETTINAGLHYRYRNGRPQQGEETSISLPEFNKHMNTMKVAS